MRTAILGSLAALCLATAIAGCKDNEESFYIEHMKALPDPPDCVVSAGDAVEDAIVVDALLAPNSDLFMWYQTTNALVARENYDNLVAESNGIFLEGSEASMEVGGQTIGTTSYRTLDMFLAAESSDVIPALSISADAFQELPGLLGCPTMQQVAQTLTADLALDGRLDASPVPGTTASGTVSVRMIGHTQGGVDVETQTYSMPLEVCCGCLVDWNTCLDAASAFCDTPSEYSSCAPGIAGSGDLYPCNGMTHNESAQWNMIVDGGTISEDCASATNH